MVLLSHPFQSTLPLRGATSRNPINTPLFVFQSTLPLRGATLSCPGLTLPSVNFNPHSPCGERHARTRRHRDILCYFNPHSPCGERRSASWTPAWPWNFNPHSPCGERPAAIHGGGRADNFNPHSPCGERPVHAPLAEPHIIISIHTPPAGSDNWWFRAFRPSRNFNPHSPCGERPGLRNPTKPLSAYFNPHSPCGERRWTVPSSVDSVLFQSTLPLRGATWVREPSSKVFVFQSTLPLRGATRSMRYAAELVEFQSTLPLRGATYCPAWPRGYGSDFNPHSPCGERPQK